MLRISLLLALLFLGVALVAAQEEEDVEGERTSKMCELSLITYDSKVYCPVSGRRQL